MRFYKSETLTICTRSFLRKRLIIFDEAIKGDPTLITEENKILRVLFAKKLENCRCFLCVYNSRNMIAEANSQIKH